MLRLLIVTGVCELILMLVRTTAASSTERCASHPIINFSCTEDELVTPRKCAVETSSNSFTCTYTSVSKDEPFDFTLGMGEMTSNVPGEVSSLHAEYYYFPGHDNCYRAGLRISWTAPRNGLQWLKGFLLTVTEEMLGSVHVGRWFSISSPLTADVNVTFNYECIKVRQMATHTIRLYSLPRRSPHDVPTVFMSESNQHGCTRRSRCFNPLVVANAFENNSVMVTFTNPPQSFSYENYDACLKYRWSVKYIQTVNLENANLTRALFHNVLPGTYSVWVQPRPSSMSSCERYRGMVCRWNSCGGTPAVSKVTLDSSYDDEDYTTTRKITEHSSMAARLGSVSDTQVESLTVQSRYDQSWQTVAVTDNNNNDDGTTREITEHGSMTAKLGSVSDTRVESFAVQSRYDQPQDSVPTWQTVVVISASLITLAFVAVVVAWKLRQSVTGTTSTSGNASQRHPTQPPQTGDTMRSVSSVPTCYILSPENSDEDDDELTPSVVENIVNTFNTPYDEQS